MNNIERKQMNKGSNEIPVACNLTESNQISYSESTDWKAYFTNEELKQAINSNGSNTDLAQESNYSKESSECDCSHSTDRELNEQNFPRKLLITP